MAECLPQSPASFNDSTHTACANVALAMWRTLQLLRVLLCRDHFDGFCFLCLESPWPVAPYVQKHLACTPQPSVARPHAWLPDALALTAGPLLCGREQGAHRLLATSSAPQSARCVAPSLTPGGGV